MSASISWLSDESFTFNGEVIQMSSFERNFILGMINDAQRILQDKLLFATSLPEVPLTQIADVMENTANGYSFITEPRNVALFSHDFSTLQSRNLAPEDLPQYIGHVNSFLELVLMLCLVTGDQPPHSYDLTTLAFVNTQFYARSLFIMGEGILKRESKQRLGVEMDLAGYKAVFLAISKRFNPGRFDDLGNCLTCA